MILPISFTEEDAKHVDFPINGPLVSEAQISNKRVSRILMDNGSSVNVPFKFQCQVIGFMEVDLSPYPIQLQYFNRDVLIIMVKILPMTFKGENNLCAFKHYTFVVVDCPIAYNATLG
uniref:Uncharacterized protein n=1 Tax=Cannabis sativa TaxID=3483 RepID=A0A803PRB0_CANSA